MRTALNKPFTTMEKMVVLLVARGATYNEIAKRLCIAYGTARMHARMAAKKIPHKGLTVREAIVFWWRGATRDMLMGVLDEE